MLHLRGSQQERRPSPVVRAVAVHHCGPLSGSEPLGKAFHLSASSNEGKQVYLLHRVIMRPELLRAKHLAHIWHIARPQKMSAFVSGACTV